MVRQCECEGANGCCAASTKEQGIARLRRNLIGSLQPRSQGLSSSLPGREEQRPWERAWVHLAL